MALVLIKETGACVAGANSYADAADGDDYHDGHCYASAWTSATTGQKEAALVMATRLIDAYCEFGGSQVVAGQALQWPRFGCPDRDSALIGNPLRAWGIGLGCFDSSTIPSPLKCATCEQARCLLVEDLTLPAAGAGLKSSAVANLKTVFDKTTAAPVLSRITRRFLGKLGTVLGDGGVARLTRA